MKKLVEPILLPFQCKNFEIMSKGSKQQKLECMLWQNTEAYELKSNMLMNRTGCKIK
jgi:hypothetical protein